ncbi:MAG: GNAT family N-acetyltransferase [Paraburkholderia sp.]|uniref:GNAT family N-acetyltransferase n=1 Tax=Paraburkholderia sp. TaxID=1926495 RepID=UPI003C46C0E9
MYSTFQQTMTTRHSIRRARATDLPTIYAGELDYIRQIEPHQEARWKDAMYSHIKQWTNDLGRMFVVQCGDEVGGYCFWEVHNNAAVLASIYVVPERRRDGLGKQLLASFMDDAQAAGFGTLQLGVKPDNPARYLYERTGFIYTHDEGGYRHYAYDATKVASN